MSGSLWDQINAGCHELSGVVGAATGAAYSHGALSVTGSPTVAAGVGQVIEDTVSDNWQHVCDLPQNLGLVSSGNGFADLDGQVCMASPEFDGDVGGYAAFDAAVGSADFSSSASSADSL
jgi:hypothetical protein